MPAETWNRDDMLQNLIKAAEDDKTWLADTQALMNTWLARGDGIAVYENRDFNSPYLGHRKYTSFGSSAAQLEVEAPPDRLPDIGNEINWRYILRATYRGKAL